MDDGAEDVGVEQQPVLHIRTDDLQEVINGAVAHALVRFVAERVRADVVGDTGRPPALSRDSHQLRGLGRSHGERLFAKHVFSGM